MIYGIYLAEPDTVLVFGINFGVFRSGTRLAMPKTIYAPDSSSLKPGSGATKGVLDKGVLNASSPDLLDWAEDPQGRILMGQFGQLPHTRKIP